MKYNSQGLPLWARSVSSTLVYSEYFSVSVDGDGGVYAAGYIDGNLLIEFGNDVGVTGGHNRWNVMIVKYNSLGSAQWCGPGVLLLDHPIHNSLVFLLIVMAMLMQLVISRETRSTVLVME